MYPAGDIFGRFYQSSWKSWVLFILAITVSPGLRYGACHLRAPKKYLSGEWLNDGTLKMNTYQRLSDTTSRSISKRIWKAQGVFVLPKPFTSISQRATELSSHTVSGFAVTAWSRWRVVDQSPWIEAPFQFRNSSHQSEVFVCKWSCCFLQHRKNCFVGDQDRSVCEKRVYEQWLREEVGGGGRKDCTLIFKKGTPTASCLWLST